MPPEEVRQPLGDMKMTEITKRILTAAVVIPALSLWLFAAKFYEADWAVGILLALVTLLCGLEYLMLLERSGIILEKYSFLALAVLLEFSYVLLAEEYAALVFWGVIIFLILIYLPGGSLREIFAAVFGLLYIPYLLHFFYLLYKPKSGGHLYALFVLILNWCYDIGAYATGSLWGKHKLAPLLSPKKSWEGILGGLVFTLIGASPVWIWVPTPSIAVPNIIIISLLVVIFSQLGDLFESKLKRTAGVKDSGSFFPGHGGMLDKVDGLLFVLPVIYFYFRYVLKLA